MGLRAVRARRAALVLPALLVLALEGAAAVRVGQARKRDTAEAGIVQALRRVGALVFRVSEPGAPDLVAYHRGALALFEVKTGKGRMTPAQATARAVGWPVQVIRTPEEALRALGVTR